MEGRNLTSIKLTLNGAQAWASVEGPLTSGMVGIPVTIEYGESWDGLTKNLMCRCSPWGSDDGEIRTILNVGTGSTVAHEVMQAGMYLYLGVEGFSSDGKLVIPTTWARCGKIEYGANTGDDPTADPELPIWGQLQTEMEQLRQDILAPELRDELNGYVQSAARAADTAQTYAEKANTSADSAAALANGALLAQEAAEAAAERAEAAAVPGTSLCLTVETITVGEESGEAVPVTGITLDYTSLSLKAGDMMQLAAMVTPVNATNTAVIWETSDGNVATVSDGLVTARAEGNAVITARSAENSSITATCAVSVAAAESGGGETAGQKIQFSTLELTPGGFKGDGTSHELSSTYHVVIPYTEGMQIRTLWNGAWNAGTYPAILVLHNGTYTAVPAEYALNDDGSKKTMTVEGKVPNLASATLTGYAAGSDIIVGMLIGTTDATTMDETDYLYYIPGGES